MVSDTFHNVGVMIDPKRRKSSCCFPGADARGWGREGVGADLFKSYLGWRRASRVGQRVVGA